MNRRYHQTDLFSEIASRPPLPTDYEPVRPANFEVSQIYLTRSSVATPERRQFVERICRLYPEAQVKECLDTPHNRIELDEADALALHQLGKRTLVFGELKTAVRFSREARNACPNYWHFSPYGFCPYGCKYCYLAGTTGVKFSPTVKIYVNLPEMLAEIDIIARSQGRPTAFYLGKLQDALALDPLTAYSTVLMPFFAEHPWARRLMEQKMGLDNTISAYIDDGSSAVGDGRARYPQALRNKAYSLIIQAARRLRSDLELALCLEEKALWQSTRLEDSLGRCNCVL